MSELAHSRPLTEEELLRCRRVAREVAACEDALAEDPIARMRDADVFLRQTSWDGTWAQMRAAMLSCLTSAEPARAAEAL